MAKEELRQLLEQVRSGRVGLDDALERLGTLPYDDLGFTVLDRYRALRKGFPEVIFGQAKTDEQIAWIFGPLGRPP